MVYIPALAGGVFGLLGGYLTDLLGRRRVLTASILLYAVSALLSGFATSLLTLLVLRSATFVGVCVEFVAAVAWLAELFDNPHQRERVLGYTQAFSSLGGLLVASAYGICVAYSKNWMELQVPSFLSGFGQIDPEHTRDAWRWTLISGLLPALPLILIRPFLPESPKWK
jgi:MFS family permease